MARNLSRHHIKVYPHDGHQDKDTVVQLKGEPCRVPARELLNVSNANTTGRQYLPIRASGSTSHKLHLWWQAPAPHRASLTTDCKHSGTAMCLDMLQMEIGKLK